MARLYLDAGQTFGVIGPFGVTNVIGTNGNEKVQVAGNGKATFDPSFNRGGDEIIIEGDSSGFAGVLSGSSLLITSDVGAEVRIPVGRTGATVTFENGSFELILANNSVTLGDQVITTTAAFLENLGGDGAAAARAPLSSAVFEDVAPPAPELEVSNYLYLG